MIRIMKIKILTLLMAVSSAVTFWASNYDMTALVTLLLAVVIAIASWR